MAKKQQPIATMDRDGLKIRILILDRGFVYVCRCENPMNSGFWLPVTHQRCIRRWGTEGTGLADLCDGPNPETILEPICLEATIPIRAIINVMEVEQNQWEKHLS